MATKKDRGLMKSHGTKTKATLSSTYKEGVTAKTTQSNYAHNTSVAKNRKGKEKNQAYADAYRVQRAERKQAIKNGRKKK